eukprot:TRINITY_DN8091_c0_g1_i1.p1 TRINITY_DN8091_c0_g1~~TRINITY_DN8091_c0_g1_i1.p1  ORF type:complete len:619 (-),score=167.60 TRINITY_DN8091_c0_g1_i1:157-2013(-)
MEGNLLKKGGYDAWQRRFFQVVGHELEYYGQKGDGNKRGSIDLRCATVGPEEYKNKRNVFFIDGPCISKRGKRYLIAASSDAERDRWITGLRELIADIGTEAALPESAKIIRPLSIPEQQGWLFVYAGNRKVGGAAKWDKRWIELHGGFVQKVYLFRDPVSQPILEFDVSGCTLTDHPSNPFAFTITGLNGELTLAGDGDFRKDGWWKEFVRAIRGECVQVVQSATAIVSPTSATPVLSDYTLLKVVGKGAFGTVLKVRHNESGDIFALKSLVKTSVLEKGLLQRTVEESMLHHALVHPYVLRLHQTFQTLDRLFLVFDFLPGGNLWYWFDKPFPEDMARFYAAQLLLAVEYLASVNIVHRDIKPDNILLDADGNLRLSDFGMATKYEGKPLVGYTGVVAFAAPELVAKQGYGPPIDLWASGVVIFKMLCGRLPFILPKGEEAALREMIQKEEPPYPEDLSPAALSLLKTLLNKDPAARSLGELKGHPFFEGLSWDDMRTRRATPPIKPEAHKGADVKYVPRKYSDLPPELEREQSIPEVDFEGFTRDPTIDPVFWQTQEFPESPKHPSPKVKAKPAAAAAAPQPPQSPPQSPQHLSQLGDSDKSFRMSHVFAEPDLE